MQIILNKMEELFKVSTGYSYNGVIKTIGAIFSSIITEVYGKIDFVKKQSFISTADKDYLYLLTGKIVEPLMPVEAGGGVVFFGQDGTTIPTGTILEFENIGYKTLANVEISNGSAKVSCVCLEDGKRGNRLAGEELRIKNSIQGVDKCIVEIIRGGRDIESLEEYRSRVINFFKYVQSPFNKNNIRMKILENIRTIKYVWVKGGEYKEGQVHIYALNFEDNLRAEEENDIRQVISQIIPPHLKSDKVTIKKPKIENVTIRITELLPKNSEIVRAVEDEIRKHFDGDLFEKPIEKEGVESVVYRLDVNGVEVEKCRVDAGFDKKEETIYRIEKVIVV